MRVLIVVTALAAFAVLVVLCAILKSASDAELEWDAKSEGFYGVNHNDDDDKSAQYNQITMDELLKQNSEETKE